MGSVLVGLVLVGFMAFITYVIVQVSRKDEFDVDPDLYIKDCVFVEDKDEEKKNESDICPKCNRPFNAGIPGLEAGYCVRSDCEYETDLRVL